MEKKGEPVATFNLPELGEGLEEGEIVEWKVKEGDAISADQTMVEVMTDKASIEVPAPAAGKVTKLYYKVGDIAQVGSALIDIEASGEAAAAKSEQKEELVQAQSTAQVGIQETSKKEATTGAVMSAVPAIDRSSFEKVLASPAVRKMAREMGVDLTQVQGTGDRGRVLRIDLENPSVSSSGVPRLTGLPSVGREERIPFVGVRRKIAESLSKSAYTAVHFTHHDEADFSEILRLKDEANAYAQKNSIDAKVTFLPFIMKAAIAGLKKYPILNSYLDTNTNEVVIRHEYHFGISTQTDQGLMVAVVRDVDRKTIFELAKEISEVVSRARSGKATREDLTGSTITVTSVGNIGGLHATPVINFPEVAIIGMYQIKKRPIVQEIDGEDHIAIAPMAYMNITCDHRIVDGAIAAAFMRDLCQNLEDPARLMMF